MHSPSSTIAPRFLVGLFAVGAAVALAGRTEARPTTSADLRGAQRRPAPPPAATARARPSPAPSVLSLEGSVAWIYPPYHAGAQPVVAVLDDRCSAAECEPDPRMAAAFGWAVCVRDFRACDHDRARATASDAGAVMDSVLRTIAANDAGALAPSGGALIVRGWRSEQVASVVSATRGRWRSLLLIAPTAMPERAALTGFERVGVVAAQCPDASPGGVTLAWAQNAARSGAQPAWFPMRERGREVPRRELLRGAVQWSFAGGDPVDFLGRADCAPRAPGALASAPR